jgi:tetratricopeptide (TPR) repeat protein
VPFIPRLFISYIPDRDHFIAVEYGRAPEGLAPDDWQPVGESAAFLRDGASGPFVGFGVNHFYAVDLDDPAYAPLWGTARFAAPLLGLNDASAAEIILAARTFLGGRRTINRRLFDAAVDAQSRDRIWSLQLWLDCLKSGDAMAHFGVGYTLYDLGRFREAYCHLRHYTELAPGNPWNWRWYGVAAEAIGEAEEAALAYERAIDLGDTETDADSLLQALFERKATLDLHRPAGVYAPLPMTHDEQQPRLGARFDDALAFTARVHRTQRRKGGEIPYVGHLLGVCSLVIEDGGTEDEAIAALLHDAVEDQGGDAMLEQIRERYGPLVADIVLACSDTTEMAKPPWRERKEAYLVHLDASPISVLRVSLADKLYNARAILRDYELDGEQVWERFNQRAGRDGQLWYYDELATRFSELYPSPMAAELREVVNELREEALSA